MKRLSVFLIAIGLLVALAACQDQPQAEPTEPALAAAESEAGIITEQAAEEGAEAVQEATAMAEEPTAVPPTEEPAAEPEPTEEPVEETAEATEEPVDEPVEEAAVQTADLYVPRDVQREYDTGKRSPDGNPGPNYWQNHSVHDMSITVNPPDRTIQATQDIVYTNNSPNPLSIVAFRMYQNVRRQEAQRERYITEDYFTDGIQVNEFAINGEVTEWAPLDLPIETVKLIRLPAPLAPGDSIEFSFDWQYELSLQPLKEGVVEPTTFYLAYFFPRLAVVGELDRFSGWDVEEYTYRPGRELNNEFADFTFEVNVPPNFAVWATGELLNPADVLQQTYLERLQDSFTSDEVIQIATPEEMQSGQVTAQSDTVTWRWQADNVLDIAIGISDSYFWDAGSVVVDAEDGRRASVQAAYDAEATDFQNMVTYAKDALDYASNEWPGVPYPYSKMTGFLGGADEEFPMMYNDSSKADDPDLTAFIAAHEILHTYFPFYMGTNEQRYPMLDEGWTTAFEYPFSIQAFGQEWADDIFIERRSGRLTAPESGIDIPIITPADSMRGNVVGYNGYEKSAMGILALWDLMGDAAFKEALHTFIDRWHGKHPLPWDMFNTFDDVTEEDLTWFFQRWYFEPNYVDLRIENVTETENGYEVEIANIGGWPVPFDIDLILADGTTESTHYTPEVWQTSPNVLTVSVDTDQEVSGIVLDGGIFADATEANNGWPEGILDLVAMRELTDSFVALPAEVTPGFTASGPAGWTAQPTANGVNLLGAANGIPQLQFAVVADSTIPEAMAPTGLDLDEALLGAYEANGLRWSIFDGVQPVFQSRYAMAESDGNVYAVSMISSPDEADAFLEAVLYPALDSFIAGEQTSEAAGGAEMEDFCDLTDLPYPRPEPDYGAKRVRDLSPFEGALAAYTDERRAELDGLLTGATIPDIQALFDSGELSSEELVVYYVDRIQRYDINGLNSVLELNPQALEVAREYDDQRAAGNVTGGMQGIPVLLKDNIATEGMGTTAGTVVMDSWEPDRDAGLVTKLKQAGAIILGKANLSEWANYMDSCMPNGFSALGGQTENPYGPFETYGSSSGSAVAAAANLAAATVGSETQGSILRPAEINNVVGLKTSKGLVSGDYIIPLLPFQDVAGPMGRSVTDVATLLTAIAGVDENDPETQNAAELDGVDFAQFASLDAAQGQRIGIVVQTEASVAALLDQFGVPEEEREEVTQALLAQNDPIRAVGSLFTAAGMEVVEIPIDVLPVQPNVQEALPPGFKRGLNAFLDSLGEAAPVASLEEVIAFNNDDPDNRIPYGQDHLEETQASDLTDEEWEALRGQFINDTQAAFQSLFETYDVSIFVENSTQAYAAAGYPAITVPVGLGPDGQPLGYHIVGDYLSEPLLITAGYVLEQSVDPWTAPDIEATLALIEEVNSQ